MKLSIKKPSSSLWETNYDVDVIKAKLNNGSISENWLVCPSGEPNRAIKVSELIEDVSLLKPIQEVQKPTLDTKKVIYPVKHIIILILISTIIGPLVGSIVGILLGELLVILLSISDFEGGSGYFVFFLVMPLTAIVFTILSSIIYYHLTKKSIARKS